MAENDGWIYDTNPPASGDCRKFVTLEHDGMMWVGIRAFHHSMGKWLNNSEPEKATVKAWRDLPEPARGYFDRGTLRIPATSERKAFNAADVGISLIDDTPREPPHLPAKTNSFLFD